MSQIVSPLPETAIPLRSIIALGANLPLEQQPLFETLERAILSIEKAGLHIDSRSRWYESPAWPVGAGPDFVNGAIAVTGVAGDRLLQILQNTETELGRTRKAGRWDARVCDLDLLCTDQMILPDAATWHQVAAGPAEAQRPRLVLPHPLLHTRAFVLVPMAEIAPDWRHPLLGRSAAEMLDDLPAEAVAEVRPLSPSLPG